jgi:ring-1,2-phenylacetyl-CoA epoxidase subunit PaaD
VFSREEVLRWLGQVADPEIPVLSITDLGIVREVEVGERVTVSLSPTYSGCPATEVIEQSVLDALRDHGVEDVEIRRVLSPPWTTDWISEEGRDKLRRYGIAPPEQGAGKRALLGAERQVACPRCGATATELVSEFGSTACKASYRCSECLEPFEYFKCI